MNTRFDGGSARGSPTAAGWSPDGCTRAPSCSAELTRLRACEITRGASPPDRELPTGQRAVAAGAAAREKCQVAPYGPGRRDPLAPRPIDACGACQSSARSTPRAPRAVALTRATRTGRGGAGNTRSLGARTRVPRGPVRERVTRARRHTGHPPGPRPTRAPPCQGEHDEPRPDTPRPRPPPTAGPGRPPLPAGSAPGARGATMPLSARIHGSRTHRHDRAQDRR